MNFKLYHSLGLRYPPVLDTRLEEAAAGLAAVMQDLAAGATGAQQAQQQRQLEGGGGGAAAAEAAGAEGGERGVNPEAQQRMASLSDKVRQLEQEIRGERPRGSGDSSGGEMAGGGPAASADEEGGSEEDEEAELEIDSGDDAASDDSEEEEVGACLGLHFIGSEGCAIAPRVHHRCK